jgi:tRNA A-37 threonylcarbamoyl transferase component Bud32
MRLECRSPAVPGAALPPIFRTQTDPSATLDSNESPRRSGLSYSGDRTLGAGATERELRPDNSDAPTRTLDSTASRGAGLERLSAPDALRDLPAPTLQTLDALRSRIDHEEHTGNVIRMRKAAFVGAILWPLYFPADWMMTRYYHPVSFGAYAAIRICAWCSIIGGYLLLRLTRKPTRATLLASELMVYGTAALGASLMCALDPGLASPYVAGIPVVFTVRAAFIHVPFRSALVPLIPSALTYPLVLLGEAAWKGQLAQALAHADQVAVFILYNALIWTSLGATVAGGHAVWALRRQIFEARCLGRYRLVRPLASGGMGEVWLAQHATLRRQVAIKILRTDRLSEVALRRFEREVHATTELTHPNTVRVFDYGVTDDGLWYYAMELLEGQNLAQCVHTEGAMPECRAVHLVLQASGALAEAHQRGIVHRDVKPENLFLCTAGGLQDFLKVIDFGIARRHDPNAAATQADRVLGTPAYVSPEVALGGHADARSDVYGLGGVLYFLLTGCTPFHEVPEDQLLRAHVSREPTTPSQRRDQAIHPELEQITLRCLAKNPAERFAHAGELWEALKQLQDRL